MKLPADCKGVQKKYVMQGIMRPTKQERWGILKSNSNI